MGKQSITFKNSRSQRVDKYLSTEYTDLSRQYFQDGLKDGKILVNGNKKSPSYKLKENDEIEIKLSLEKPVEVTELPIDKKVKFEVVAKYPDFFIINKPTGLVVHPSVFDVQNNSIPPNLAGGLLALDKNLKNVGEDILTEDAETATKKDITRPGIVHRLDKNTSGLMIVPRTQEAFIEFKRQFKNREVSKTYMALCWNIQSKKDELKLAESDKIEYKEISTLMGKSKGDHTKQSTNKNVRYLINPKEATTFYAMIRSTQFPCAYKSNGIKKQSVSIALIQAKPKSGRKHQVRVHLSSVGLPLIGDKKYTSKILKNCNKDFKHHLLQAHKLEFTYKGEKYSFTSELPKYFKELMTSQVVKNIKNKA
jgi:23S rRNA pseudouridine1911/1915/1917 synthase